MQRVVKYVSSELAKCNLDHRRIQLWVEHCIYCGDDAATIAVKYLTGDRSPLQDKDPADGGAVVSAAKLMLTAENVADGFEVT